MAHKVNEHILYEPDERPPFLAAAGLGLQAIMGMLVAMAAFVAITVRTGEQSDSYLSWAIFSAFAVSGIVIVLQSIRVWRFGARYTLICGPSAIFVVICAIALKDGGPAMMSTLIVVSTIFQFALTARLSLLRRVITPTVSGTVLLLLAGTAMSVVLGTLSDDGSAAPAAAGPVTAGVSLAVVLALRLFATPSWQQWTPIIGIAVGCAAAVMFGLYDFTGVIEASLFGVPELAWPGFDLNLGVQFWALLPGFIVVFLAATINSIGEGIAVQRVSWRRPRAIDFRMIQGALNTVSVGNLMAALLGTIPVTIFPANAARSVLTGVAARQVGMYGGVILVGVALLPKFLALIAAIPSPVLAAYVVVMLGLLFVEGMKIIVQDGIDVRKSTVVGVSFWIGMGFQFNLIFPEYLTGTWGTLLGNGMTVGSITAILMTLLLEAPNIRRRRLNVTLGIESLPELDRFLRSFAASAGWNEASTDHLRSAGEETLSSLLAAGNDSEANGRRLSVTAHLSGRTAELEFIAASEEENLEDRIAYLNELTESPDEREISFRLLRHYASSVRHRKYYGLDVVTVHVERAG